MNSKEKLLFSRIMGLILMSVAPLLPLATYIYFFITAKNSNSSDDAIGWGILILLVIAIGISPVILASTVPFFIYLFSFKRIKEVKKVVPLFVLSNIFVSIELYIFYRICGRDDSIIPILIFLWIIYVVLEVVCIAFMSSALESNSKEAENNEEAALTEK